MKMSLTTSVAVLLLFPLGACKSAKHFLGARHQENPAVSAPIVQTIKGPLSSDNQEIHIDTLLPTDSVIVKVQLPDGSIVTLNAFEFDRDDNTRTIHFIRKAGETTPPPPSGSDSPGTARPVSYEITLYHATAASERALY